MLGTGAMKLIADWSNRRVPREQPVAFLKVTANILTIFQPSQVQLYYCLLIKLIFFDGGLMARCTQETCQNGQILSHVYDISP